MRRAIRSSVDWTYSLTSSDLLKSISTAKDKLCKREVWGTGEESDLSIKCANSLSCNLPHGIPTHPQDLIPVDTFVLIIVCFAVPGRQQNAHMSLYSNLLNLPFDTKCHSLPTVYCLDFSLPSKGHILYVSAEVHYRHRQGQW